MSNSRQQMKAQKKNRSRRRIFLWVMLPPHTLGEYDFLRGIFI
jgi:hypothetical protein